MCTVAGPPAGTPYPARFISDIDWSELPGISCEPVDSPFLRRAYRVAKLIFRLTP